MAAKEQTTTYSWGDGNVIQRIDVRTQKNGFAVAYLYADPSEKARTQRLDIRSALRLKGWGTLSDSRNGEFALRVTGLHSADELLSMLQGNGFIASTPQIRNDTNVTQESKGWIEEIKSHTLRFSGILATIGNAMSIASGFHRLSDPRLTPKEKKEKFGQIGMGTAFAMADLPLMLVDEQDNSRQLASLLKKLRSHYEKDGIDIPKNASIYVETSDKGKNFGQRFQDFLHDYANPIKCGFEVVASGFAIKAGFDQQKKGNKSIPWKSVAGAIFGPAFFASLVIPEKKIDEEKYAKASALGKFWMRIQSNPLAIGGLLGYSNTAATYFSAYTEHKEQLALKKGGDFHTPYYRWDYAIPTVMIGANGLYAMSKKTVGGDIKNDAMVQDAYRIASQIINKQPPELREKAIESTARFFAERTEIKEHYAEAKARLVQELDSQRQNPWFEPRGLPPYVPQAKKYKQHEVAPELAVAKAPQPVVQLEGLTHQSPPQTAAAAHTLTH